MGSISEISVVSPRKSVQLPFIYDPKDWPERPPTLPQLLADVHERGGDKPALAERTYEIRKLNGEHEERKFLPRWNTISYHESWARIRAIASELHHDPVSPLGPGGYVCLLGVTGMDYITVQMAAWYLGACIVPTQSVTPLANLVDMVNETEAQVLAVTVDQVDRAVEVALKSGTVKRIFVMSCDMCVSSERSKVDVAQKRLADAGSLLEVEPLERVLRNGKCQDEAPLYQRPADTNPLVLVMYTSGSTGTPKGAMFSDQHMIKSWTHSSAGSPGDTVLNFYPMSHGTGQHSLALTLCSNGTAYFIAKTDMSTLLEDLALCKPRSITLVPRITDTLIQWYTTELAQRLKTNPDRAACEAEVKNELRDKVLGGRVGAAVTGSAPVPMDSVTFMESVLDVKMRNFYGCTEVGAISIDGKIMRDNIIDYKLEDVPEMGYYKTNKPYPRGQLLVKSRSLISGYFKRPELNDHLFDKDGFYMTGDIVALKGPDLIEPIDRANNVMKLSQGEFVSIARLESLFVNSKMIHQISIYGEGDYPYLLAIIVPSEAAEAEATRQQKSIKTILHHALKEIADGKQLNTWEVPRDFILELEPFSAANGLLSDIMKPLRPRIKARYLGELKSLYASLSQKQEAEIQMLHSLAGQRPTIETVQKVAEALLGDSSSEFPPHARLVDIGGDSISSFTVSNLLHSIFNVDIPLSVVLNPANDLQAIAQYIDSASKSISLFSRVHGNQPVDIQAIDFKLDKFIPQNILTEASKLPKPSAPPRTVLITGANGFLGRFIVLDWLEQLHAERGKVICLVRGKDSRAARRRLEESFETGDAVLKAHFKKLASKTLEVLHGDISLDSLGVDLQTWQYLADNVDLIVHNGAWVNHVLPYAELFLPNVAGTARLIELALTTKMKRFIYVSTMGVPASHGGAIISSDDDIRVALPNLPAQSTNYGNGYRVSKWAGEVLLREANDELGLPSTIFRSGMILAHSTYSGQLNVPDMFTRLVFSLVATGLAPASFYALNDKGEAQSSTYEGVPVEFLASTINKLGKDTKDSVKTMNAFTAYDGPSMDSLLTWLEASGIKLQRVDDFQDWFTRFDAAVRALPEAARKYSLLPIMGAYANPMRSGLASNGTTEHATNGVAINGVATNGVGSETEHIPRLSKALVEKYLSDIKQFPGVPPSIWGQ